MLCLHRYAEAKDLAKTLEKQASKVLAEAGEAGDKANKILANLTSIPPFDTKSLEVSTGKPQTLMLRHLLTPPLML